MSLFSKTLSGARWVATARVAQQVLQFGVSVILMRLLGPDVFGLLGMVIVFSGFAQIVGELGFGSVIVQRKRLLEAHRSTAFWICQIIGVALCVLMLVLAPALAAFYDEETLIPIAQWISLSFLLGAPGIVSRGLLQRTMRFDLLAKIDISGALVSSGCAVMVAFMGGGIWSLVVHRLVSTLWGSVAVFLAARWVPRQGIRRRAIRAMFSYGANLTGFNAVNYWARSADNLLIGKFLGSEPLGLYSRAYALMLLPLKQVVSVLAQVMFPALASIQGDKERVRRAYLRAVLVISAITFPMMVGLIVVADAFVLTLFGEKWAELIPLVRILAGVGVIQSLCNPTGWIYTSQGRTDLMFRWGLFASAVFVGFIVAGIVIGSVEAVAWAYVAANLVLAWPCIAIAGSLVGLKVMDVLNSVRGPGFCAAAMAAIVLAADRLVMRDFDNPVRLVVLVSLGLFVYGALSMLVSRSLCREVIGVLSPGSRKGGANRGEGLHQQG